MATIGLVSCVSQKRLTSAEAKDLYISALFVKARAYAERHCSSWFILSAKYALVSPDQVVAPYDETLNSMRVNERKEWTTRVWRDLAPHVGPGDDVVILAGMRYREFLVPLLQQRGCKVLIPLEGLTIGRQLQWLSASKS